MAIGMPPTMITSMLVRVGHFSANNKHTISNQNCKSASTHAGDKSTVLTNAQVAGVLVVAELHPKLNDAPHPNCDQADTTNTCHNLLQVGNVVCALHSRLSQQAT